MPVREASKRASVAYRWVEVGKLFNGLRTILMLATRVLFVDKRRSAAVTFDSSGFPITVV